MRFKSSLSSFGRTLPSSVQIFRNSVDTPKRTKVALLGTRMTGCEDEEDEDEEEDADDDMDEDDGGALAHTIAIALIALRMTCSR